MNRFYEKMDTAIKQDSEAYELLVNAIDQFKRFTIDDIYRAVNRKLPKGAKVNRYKVADTLRVLLKARLIMYDLDNQIMLISTNKKTDKK